MRLERNQPMEKLYDEQMTFKLPPAWKKIIESLATKHDVKPATILRWAARDYLAANVPGFDPEVKPAKPTPVA
jgi:hypothetical protein